MHPRTFVKFFVVISAASMAAVLSILAATNNPLWATYIGLLADSLALLLFIISSLRKEVSMENVPAQVNIVYEYVTKERERTRATRQIISKLIKEGLIKESDILSLIRNKEMFLAFSYGESVAAKGLRELLKGQPLGLMLAKIGFVRVAFNQNLFVAMSENLPSGLRSMENLNTFIKEHLPKEWNRIAEEINTRYPREKYEVWYEKWRTPGGFKVSYVLAKLLAQDFIVEYMNRNSFTTEFQDSIGSGIDSKRLKKMLAGKKQKVLEIVSRISIDTLVEDIQKKVRNLIADNEEQIRRALDVKTITDYRLLQPSKIAEVLVPAVPDIDESTLSNCCSIIVQRSQEIYDALGELGIVLK